MCCLLFRSFWLTCAEGGDNDVHACRIESTWSVGLLYQRKRVYSSSSASGCLFIRVNIQFTCICRHFIRVSAYPVVLPVSGKTPNCHHGAPSISCHWLGTSCPGQIKDLKVFKKKCIDKKNINIVYRSCNQSQLCRCLNNVDKVGLLEARKPATESFPSRWGFNWDFKLKIHFRWIYFILFLSTSKRFRFWQMNFLVILFVPFQVRVENWFQDKYM